MTVQTSTGVRVGIVAASPTTIDPAGFNALTYINISEVTDIPEIGADITVVTFMALADGIVRKFKGFKNFGSFPMGFGDDITDLGQLALESAATGTNENVQHSMEIILQDGKKIFFTCKIFSFKINPGSADSIVSATSAVEIESKLVRA